MQNILIGIVIVSVFIFFSGKIYLESKIKKNIEYIEKKYDDLLNGDQ
jgi:hypothetical protein